MTLSLNGKHVIVTSGPTREHIDPVRYITNESSGRQGHAVAAAFAKAGAHVTLISGPVSIEDPEGVRVVHITTALEMLEATLSALPADVAVCAAAVADYRPKHPSNYKLKKRANEDGIAIALIQNPDILATIAEHRLRPSVVIGFAAETENLIANAKVKLKSKGADIILANDVSGGAIFASERTHLFAVTKKGESDWGDCTKQDAAERLVAAVAGMLRPRP